MSSAPTWAQALTRYTALHLVFKADNEWGPLKQSQVAQRLLGVPCGRPEGETPEQFSDATDAANNWNEREMARHMPTIWDPMIAAALALMRTPAPDLAAVQVKHELCMDEDFDLLGHEVEHEEFFDIIRADVQRLTGIVA
jgi:hypothetical protein